MMRFSPVVLVTAASIVVAQQPEDTSEFQPENDVYNEETWMRVSFDDRERLFAEEAPDREWAPVMEQAIKEKVAEFDRPLEQVLGQETCRRLPLCQEEMPEVQLASVECRRTLCRLEMSWPPNTSRAVVGQQVSFLYGLGIDHQGETNAHIDADRYWVKLIAQRRVP